MQLFQVIRPDSYKSGATSARDDTASRPGIATRSSWPLQIRAGAAAIAEDQRTGRYTTLPGFVVMTLFIHSENPGPRRLAKSRDVDFYVLDFLAY